PPAAHPPTARTPHVSVASDPSGDPIAPPPGANDWSCRPSAAHPNPVVLVHGTFANRYDNWLALSPMLASRGYCVFALDYGAPAGNIIQGIGPVADSAGQLADFVDTVLAHTGATKVDLVGHSQGGMMPRYYLKFLGGAAHVNSLVALAPSNHGTTLDGLVTLAEQFPGAADIVYTACPACRDQVRGSDMLTSLNSGGDTVPGVRYTVISTRFDEVVTPYTTQALSGSAVTNVVVQDDCAVDLAEHAAVAFDPTSLHEVRNALDPAHATPVGCG
ncbi:MAG: alpha/beta fold hydrolase, partial [Actinocatenispora sp.]